MRAFTLCLGFLAAVLVVVQSQNTTRRETVGDCQPPVEATIAALLPESFDLADGAPRPVITISDFNIVCQSLGLTRGTIGSFSVIVAFSCTTGTAVCDGSLVTNQFTYDCNEDNTFTKVTNFRGPVRRTDPVGNLMTPLDTQCGECVGPNNPFVVSDPDTHCGACRSVCNEGQRGCVRVSVTSSQFCCNWYLEGQCVVTCPGNLVGDSGPDTIYDCGCGSLGNLTSGTITYSNRFAVGSVATHTCDRSQGYVLSSESNQRTCDRTTEGWTGQTLTCNIKDCGAEDISAPQNGAIDVTSTTFGSVATFSCEDGFDLTGNQQRICELEGWSGSNPTCGAVDTTTTTATTVADITTTIASATEAGASSSCGTACIIGIVVAILAAIIIAAVVAAVAYAIYSYKTNPDTKLAKLDPNGINGVARDNPLYVEPEAVVEATDTAEAA